MHDEAIVKIWRGLDRHLFTAGEFKLFIASMKLGRQIMVHFEHLEALCSTNPWQLRNISRISIAVTRQITGQQDRLSLNSVQARVREGQGLISDSRPQQALPSLFKSELEFFPAR